MVRQTFCFPLQFWLFCCCVSSSCSFMPLYLFLIVFFNLKCRLWDAKWSGRKHMKKANEGDKNWVLTSQLFSIFGINRYFVLGCKMVQCKQIGFPGLHVRLEWHEQSDICTLPSSAGTPNGANDVLGILWFVNNVSSIISGKPFISFTFIESFFFCFLGRDCILDPHVAAGCALLTVLWPHPGLLSFSPFFFGRDDYNMFKLQL